MQQQIEDGVYISDQPSDADLRTLPNQGIRSVINLRTGEHPMGVAPGEEAHLVEDAGIAYVSIPIESGKARTEHLDRLRANLASLPRPVLVHCRHGRRSMALTIAACAPDKGWSGQEAVEEAQSRGAQLKESGLEDLIRAYVDARRGTTTESRTAAVEAPGDEPRRTKTK